MLKGQDFLPMGGAGEPVNLTRFAPSPTGYLHLGHAYAARFAFEAARASGGRFWLRIEDIDRSRCRPEFEQAMLEDLRWLEMHWDGVMRRQSEHMETYGQALRELERLGVLYPCFCSRRTIRIEVDQAGRAPHGPSDEPLYPGICRGLEGRERDARIDNGEPYALRLDVARAMELVGELWWEDVRAGWIKADPASLGDVVLARKDVPTSYHLAVTVDDGLQGVNLVTRGEDLFHATHIHRLLQALLGIKPPRWYHHNLIASTNGQRMAKRNQAVTLRHLRTTGLRPADIWQMIGLAETHAPGVDRWSHAVPVPG